MKAAYLKIGISLTINNLPKTLTIYEYMNISIYQYINISTYQYINWRKAGVLSKPTANMFTRICLLEYVYWRHRSVFSISLINNILNNWRGMEVAYLKISISLTINNLLKTPHKSLNGFIQKACMVASKSLMVASKKLVWLRPKSLYGCIPKACMVASSRSCLENGFITYAYLFIVKSL